MDPLQALLQLQLASDSYAATHLHYIISYLTADLLQTSQHIPKWTARISSLLSSKEPSARWAGLCIARQTSVFSKSIMMQSAQGWISVALPMLSKNESIPVLKASIRLIGCIFTGATDTPEFQRQISTPNVPKFSQALVNITEKYEDTELKALSLETLAKIVPLYPTLHRALHVAISSLSLRFLSGTINTPTRLDILETAARLYAALYFTGGKVGSANLWKKSLDETLAFSWSAIKLVTSTIPHKGHNRTVNQSLTSLEDPIAAIPLNLDRLKCGTTIICELLRSSVPRPVQVPVGPLTDFISVLFTCTADELVEGHVDPSVRAMEIVIIPTLWSLGCQLLSCLAKCSGPHLTPHVPKLLSYITYHTEQKLTASERLQFLQVARVLLRTSLVVHLPLLSTRLVKAILPSIYKILPVHSELSLTGASTNGGTSKKGKKRARGYEGDELFKTSKEVVFPTAIDGQVVLAALDVIQLLLHNPSISPPVHSIASRVLLSVLLMLPQMPETSLSPDPTLHPHLLERVQGMCTELGGSTGAMSKSLGLVVGMVNNGSDEPYMPRLSMQREIDLLLHPRLPPLLRSLPQVESLTLFRREESEEERGVRESIGIAMLVDPVETAPPTQANVVPDTVDHIITEPTKTGDPVRTVEPVPRPSPSLHPPAHTSSIVSGTTISHEPAFQPTLTPKSLPPVVTTVESSGTVLEPRSVAMEEDDDEEVPTINMDSDSD